VAVETDYAGRIILRIQTEAVIVGQHRPLLARKRPTVAPAEGLLTEAVLTMSALSRTATHDPFRKLVAGVSLP
jgi:hypothetical protein